MSKNFNDSFKGFGNISMSSTEAKIYGEVDGLSLQNLFYTKYGVFPGCYMFDYNAREVSDYKFDVDKILDYFKSKFPEELKVIPYIYKEFNANGSKDTLAICIVLEEQKIFGRFQASVTESYLLFDNSNYDMVKSIVNDISVFYEPPTLKNDIYWRLCFSSDRGFYLTEGKVKAPAILDIEKLYNDDFIPEHARIEEFIAQEDKSGLVILHGEKGTGKSCYIKNLIHSHPDKKFVYVPAQLITLMSDPSFGSFLATLNNHIIVLEDCENAIRDRKNSDTAASVSLLLNMTDGILSDDLGIKFICTFNEDMRNIDEALLRKGRLVSKYEFKPLCEEKAIMLLAEINNEGIINGPMTLADIFNIDDPTYEIKKGGYLE